MSDVIEIEVSEDDITAYLQDEDGNEIGFCMLDDSGVEQEYYYADDSASDDSEVIESLGVTKGEVKESAKALKESKQVASDLKSAMKDITDALRDFKNF